MKGMRFGRRFRVILFGFIIIFALTGIQVSLKAGLIGKTPTKGRPKPKPKPKPPKTMPKDLTGTVEPIWKTAVDDTNLCLDWKYGEEALLLDRLEEFEILTQNNHIYKGKNLEDLKFALVKQDVYSNLYCSPPNSYGYDIISKTMKHQGPIALFTPIVNSSYIIVSTNKDDKETAIWKEKVHDCHHFQMEETLYETRYQFRSVVSSETVCRPSELAQDPEGIDWSQFDVVITMDNPVPARITQNYPQVIWAYFITEGCMSSAKKSMVEPITGYDLYLTQNLNMRTICNHPFHVIEFPWTLAYPDIQFEFKKEPISPPDRSILLERRGGYLTNDHGFTQEQIDQFNVLLNGTVTKMSGTPLKLVEKYMKARYYIQLTKPGRGHRGNAMTEAMASGVLVIGCCVSNLDVLTLSGTRRETFEEIYDLIQELEKNPELLVQKYLTQRRLFKYLSYDRPLYQLLSKSQKIYDERNF